MPRAESRQTHRQRQVGSWTEEEAGAGLPGPRLSRSEAIFADTAGPEAEQEIIFADMAGPEAEQE